MMMKKLMKSIEIIFLYQKMVQKLMFISFSQTEELYLKKVDHRRSKRNGRKSKAFGWREGKRLRRVVESYNVDSNTNSCKFNHKEYFFIFKFGG